MNNRVTCRIWSADRSHLSSRGRQLEATTFFALLISGQTIGSLTIDYFGLLDVPVHSVSIVRIAGVTLLVGGVTLIRM